MSNSNYLLDKTYVKLTGAENIAGVKTFESFPVTPSSSPTTDYQVANKKYVDDNGGSSSSINENLLINGDFQVWQRGTGGAVSAADGYESADRWNFVNWNSVGSITRQSFTVAEQETAEMENRSPYYMQLQATSATTTKQLIQKIESVGTLSNQSATISFWAKASGTLNTAFKVRFSQNFGSGGSSTVNGLSSDAFDLTTSWQKFSYTVSVDSISGKTIGTDSFLALQFVDFANSTFTIDIANIKVEKGSVATNFVSRNLQQEIALCQRYYEKSYAINIAPGTATAGAIWANNATADSTLALTAISFKVEKRATPSCSIYSTGGTLNRVSSYSGNLTVASLSGVTTSGIGRIYTTAASTPAANSWRACEFVAIAEL